MVEKLNLTEIFGCNVFSDSAMRERLPKEVYKEYKKTVDEGLDLSPVVADVIANAMKDWQ
jgi:glutamine synthetase